MKKNNNIFYLAIILFFISPIIAMERDDFFNKISPSINEKYHDITKNILYNFKSIKDFKERSRKTIFLATKMHEKPHQILVPMWQAEGLLITPGKNNEKNTIATKQLNGCIATGLHVLFSDDSHFAGMTHYSLDPDDDEHQKEVKNLCLYVLALQNKNNTNILHVDFFTTALGNNSSNYIDNESQCIYQKHLIPLLNNFKKTVKNVFKETNCIAINHVPYNCVATDLLGERLYPKSFKIKINNDDAYLSVKGNSKIPLFTKNYLEKLTNADYSLACKLSHEYVQKNPNSILNYILTGPNTHGKPNTMKGTSIPYLLPKIADTFILNQITGTIYSVNQKK